MSDTVAVHLPNVAIGGRSLPEGALDGLRGAIRGGVLVAGDNGYEAARLVWNGVIDRRPALIVRCSGPADVIAAVNFAREHGIPLSVRGGGHNVAGGAIREGGLVIDLSRMNSVRVDAESRTVRAAGGATLGDIDHELAPFGLALPVGVVSRTGIGGLTLHGGMGFLTRRFGLTSDNLIGADVVTADGRLVTVSEGQNEDLLWALRGGGGAFGVVTSFEFRAHQVGPEVYMLIVMYPVAIASEVIRAFDGFMRNAPDEFMGLAILWNSPAEGPFPEEALDQPVAVLAGCYSGSVDDGEALTRSLRGLGEPVLDLSGPMPYLEAQRLFDPDYPDQRRYYWKSSYVRELSPGAIEVLTRYAAARPSTISSIDVWGLGGALARVPATQTAFARRDAPYLLGIEANWDDPAADAANMEWARALHRDMQPFSPGGAYLNFPGFAEEGEELLRSSYGPNFERLKQIKRKYDPENLFRSELSV